MLPYFIDLKTINEKMLSEIENETQAKLSKKFTATISQLFRASTVHGFHNIFISKRPIFKLMWTLLFSTSIGNLKNRSFKDQVIKSYLNIYFQLSVPWQ